MTKIRILDRTWRVSVIDGDAFLKRFGEEVAGFTLVETLEIVIHADELTLKTVTHELGHAYYDGLCVSSADLDESQIEEVWCELLAEHGTHLLKQARNLFKELKCDASS